MRGGKNDLPYVDMNLWRGREWENMDSRMNDPDRPSAESGDVSMRHGRSFNCRGMGLGVEPNKIMHRVMWFTHHLRGGGAEKAVVSLSEYFNSHPKLGWESYICVVYDDPELHAKLRNVLVMENHSEPGDSRVRKAFCVQRQMKELRSLKQQRQIDVCVSFLPGADILNVHSGLRAGMVVSVRNVESRFTHNIWKKWYVENSYRRCDQIVTVSKMAERDVITFFHTNPEKVTTIYNMLPERQSPNAAVWVPQDRSSEGSDEDDSHVVRDGKCAGNESAVPKVGKGGQKTIWQTFASFIQNRKVFLNVGRLAPEKGQEYLIRAFAVVHDKISDSCLVIVGGGKLHERLSCLVKELDLSEAVLFTGNVPDPEHYMARADAFVLSSLVEGMPNVVLEAMQAGLPVIATECGAREILAPTTDPCYTTDEEDDAAFGILVPTADSTVLAKAMIHLMENAALRQDYAEKASVRLRYFTPERITAEWKKVLDDCLRKRQSARR